MRGAVCPAHISCKPRAGPGETQERTEVQWKQFRSFARVPLRVPLRVTIVVTIGVIQYWLLQGLYYRGFRVISRLSGS